MYKQFKQFVYRRLVPLIRLWKRLNWYLYLATTSEVKIIVLDDDPTGSQTVHSCLLLTRWDIETLREALRDASPLFFILTNTRSVDSQEAREVTREVCRDLKRALKESGVIPKRHVVLAVAVQHGEPRGSPHGKAGEEASL